MRESTSGFWLTENENGVVIGYADYGVGMFGGGDFEKNYILDGENAEKLRAALANEYVGSLEEMIEAAFSRNFSDRKFWDFCKRNGIEYSTSTWSS